jgi:hypothetical protein
MIGVASAVYFLCLFTSLPRIDLSAVRQATNLAAVCLLLYGFIWRAE